MLLLFLMYMHTFLWEPCPLSFCIWSMDAGTDVNVTTPCIVSGKPSSIRIFFLNRSRKSKQGASPSRKILTADLILKHRGH